VRGLQLLHSQLHQLRQPHLLQELQQPLLPQRQKHLLAVQPVPTQLHLLQRKQYLPHVRRVLLHKLQPNLRVLRRQPIRDGWVSAETQSLPVLQVPVKGGHLYELYLRLLCCSQWMRFLLGNDCQLHQLCIKQPLRSMCLRVLPILDQHAVYQLSNRAHLLLQLRPQWHLSAVQQRLLPQLHPQYLHQMLHDYFWLQLLRKWDLLGLFGWILHGRSFLHELLSHLPGLLGVQ
jgi:hypothetical protein